MNPLFITPARASDARTVLPRHWQTGSPVFRLLTLLLCLLSGLGYLNKAQAQTAIRYRAVVNNGVGCANANATPARITTSAGACSVACAVLPGVLMK